jgi:hypothetical protein
MEYRNAKYNENGTIDTKINHPEFGLIPITLAKDDPETAELFEEYKDSAEPYEPPLPEELEEQKQAVINTKHRAYLAETDWYVIRMQETGKPIPDDIKAKRDEARNSIIE